MAVLQTFRAGGIHPPENKITSTQAVEALPVPAQLFVPVSQHIGKPAEPVVEKGSVVKAGQLIAKASGFISANIHSPVAGTVKKIDTLPDATGYRKTVIVIDTADEQVWEDGIDTTPDLVAEVTSSAEEIVARIHAAGIVGAGGATFPTNVKYSIPEGKTVDTLIINGVECEPYLTADHRLMLESADELIVGTRILMKALGVSRAYIGIENNKPDAIAHLRERLTTAPGGSSPGSYAEGVIEVAAMKVKYPQGGEKQLIQAITGREVPGGKLPLDVGCVVSNVSTTVSVYQAVQKGRPFIDRIVTVTGKHLVQGRNFRVLLGTPLHVLVDALGGVPEGTGKIVLGGPMTGKALSGLDVPITKGSGGLIFLDAAEARRSTVQNCIRCSRCVTVCPMGLEPYLLEKLVQTEKWEDADREGILDCIECGSCNFTCPSTRPILDLIRLGKAQVTAMRRARS